VLCEVIRILRYPSNAPKRRPFTQDEPPTPETRDRRRDDDEPDPADAELRPRPSRRFEAGLDEQDVVSLLAAGGATAGVGVDVYADDPSDGDGEGTERHLVGGYREPVLVVRSREGSGGDCGESDFAVW